MIASGDIPRFSLSVTELVQFKGSYIKFPVPRNNPAPLPGADFPLESKRLSNTAVPDDLVDVVPPPTCFVFVADLLVDFFCSSNARFCTSSKDIVLENVRKPDAADATVSASAAFIKARCLIKSIYST